MAYPLVSISIPNQTSRSQLPPFLTSAASWLCPSTIPCVKYPSRPFISLASSSPLSSASPVLQDLPSSESAVDGDDGFPFSGCKACGREEIERGCNGEGRIQGGIATVPGFGWWPIKAYRPCPGFVASGGRYRRQGQSMDEVAFGRGEQTPSSSRTGLEVESSKEKQGPRRFKR